MFCQLKHGAHAGAAAFPAGDEQEAEVPLRAVDGYAAQVKNAALSKYTTANAKRTTRSSTACAKQTRNCTRK